MTSTDLALAGQPQTTLSIAPEQTGWTPDQEAALRHMGVENATPGDLGVFFHVVKRTGLDPFARQIHMIGRNTKNQRTQQWETKYTIQTGIDGYRLIGRRAADAARATISIGAPEWAHQDGSWRPVWTPAWGHPIAARVTILRDGQPFTAVALFDEYKQTKRDGELTSMWAQRPAGQIAKCAEALAWRMAFPQDLAGIYVAEELHHTENQPERPQTPTVTAATFTNPEPEPPAEDVHDAEVDDALTDRTRRHMFALFNEQGITSAEQQREGMGRVLGRVVTSRKDITEAEAQRVITSLEARVAELTAQQDGGQA